MYKTGTYKDYAIEKEKLLLQLDSNMTEAAVIDNIVIGLPLHVQDELNREELKSTNQLMAELSQFTARPQRSSFAGSKSANWREERGKPKVAPKVFEKEKKPCTFCELIGYENFFHPLEKCRNRSKAEQLIKSPKSGKALGVHANSIDESECESTSDSDSIQSDRTSSKNAAAPSKKSENY